LRVGSRAAVAARLADAAAWPEASRRALVRPLAPRPVRQSLSLLRPASGDELVLKAARLAVWPPQSRALVAPPAAGRKAVELTVQSSPLIVSLWEAEHWLEPED